MLHGPLGTVLHGYEGKYLCHIMVHRHWVVSEDVLNRSETVHQYLTYPLLQAAGKSCHNARFLLCDRNPDIDLQLRFFLRKRIRRSLDYSGLTLWCTINTFVEVSCIDNLANVKCDHKEWHAEYITPIFDTRAYKRYSSPYYTPWRYRGVVETELYAVWSSILYWVGLSVPRSGRFTPRDSRYVLCRKLGEPQDRLDGVE